MKKNFGLGKQFYWQQPREIRRKIRNEVDAGLAIYTRTKLYTGKQWRKKVRAAGYKNAKDFNEKQMPKGIYEDIILFAKGSEK